MIVKVMLSRKVPAAKEVEMRALLIKMRSLALAQPGYVSGETLVSVDNPEEFLVISSWYSLEDWNGWIASEQRAAVQKEIDELLGEETQFRVYYHL